MAIKLRVQQQTSVKLSVQEQNAVTLHHINDVIGSASDPYEGDYEVTPTESERVLETNGKGMTDDVTVHAIPSDYIGSAIDRRDADDVMVSGASVTAPLGYYDEVVTKSVASGSVSVPSINIEAHPVISCDNNGLVSVSVSESESVSPIVSEGYVSSGNAGTITFAGTASSQLSTQGATSVHPSTSSQTAAPSGVFTTGAITVEPMDLETVTKSYTPSTSAQSETITPSAEKDGISQVNVSVSAMPAATWRGGSRIEPTISMAVDSTTGEVSASVNTSTAIMPLNGSGYADRMTTYGVTVANSNTLQLDTQAESTITPTTSEQTAVPAGTYTLGDVTVDPIPPQYIIPTGTKSITANGTGIDVTSYASVDVAVPSASPNLQNKTKSYTPSETAQSETVSADAGYDGLETVDVSVGAISSTYVGSGITRRDSTDISASGATVSVPSGFYENNASKAVANGSVTAPTTISGSGATLSTGTNTITLQKTLSVTPNVTTAGYISSGTAGNALVSLNANVTTQAAQTIYPSTSDQTINSGRYLTGNQTIKAVTTDNILAENIKSGVTVTVGDSADADRILSVTGTYTGGGGGSVQFDTKTASGGSNYPTSLSFTSMKGEPKAFVCRLNTQVSSSGSTTYYYIVDVSAFGTTTHGNCFRIGSTRRVDNITSGYSWTYSNSTLTITSSAASRSASPGAFHSGSYELLYCY